MCPHGQGGGGGGGGAGGVFLGKGGGGNFLQFQNLFFGSDVSQ